MNYRDQINLIANKRKNVGEWMDALRDAIKNLIVTQGGYINMANNDGENDNVYGAIFDYCGAGELVEVMVKAVKVENDSIYCYCAPITLNKIIYSDDDIKNDEDGWYLLDATGDLLYAYTLLDLASVFEFEEYLTSTEE